jgi:hypothetical protein
MTGLALSAVDPGRYHAFDLLATLIAVVDPEEIGRAHV